jgi:hypothetical protein
MTDEIAALVARHKLAPHPEGGFYRETFRSQSTVCNTLTGDIRSASTAILFLLTPDSFSAFHRLQSDEIWHYYEGDPIALHLLQAAGPAEIVLSPENPDFAVPAGVWQAARCSGNRYSFCGCTVAPGFEFEDFELGLRAALLAEFPNSRALIDAFTRG